MGIDKFTFRSRAAQKQADPAGLLFFPEETILKRAGREPQGEENRVIHLQK
jgi:hypothetical protein